MVIDIFLDRLRESETKQAVKFARANNLNEILTQAPEFKAVKQSVSVKSRLWAATDPWEKVDGKGATVNLIKEIPKIRYNGRFGGR